MNRNVLFDMGKKRLGFAEAECDAVAGHADHVGLGGTAGMKNVKSTWAGKLVGELTEFNMAKEGPPPPQGSRGTTVTPTNGAKSAEAAEGSEGGADTPTVGSTRTDHYLRAVLPEAAEGTAPVPDTAHEEIGEGSIQNGREPRASLPPSPHKKERTEGDGKNLASPTSARDEKASGVAAASHDEGVLNNAPGFSTNEKDDIRAHVFRAHDGGSSGDDTGEASGVAPLFGQNRSGRETHKFTSIDSKGSTTRTSKRGMKRTGLEQLRGSRPDKERGSIGDGIYEAETEGTAQPEDIRFSNHRNGGGRVPLAVQEYGRQETEEYGRWRKDSRDAAESEAVRETSVARIPPLGLLVVGIT